MTPPRHTSRRRAIVVLPACAALVACGSSAPAHRDDRSEVQREIAAYALALRQVGDIPSEPRAVLTGCVGHTANIQWSAPLVQRDYGSAARGQYETERNALSVATTPLRKLGVSYRISTGGSSEPMDVYRTDDRKTLLLLSAPRGQYVRVDGSVSC